MITSEPGQPLNLTQMRQDIQAIETVYKKNGFTYTRVYKIDYPKGEAGPLIFEIGEGIVQSVRITGNERTKDFVLLREMQLKPGSVFNEQFLRQDLRRIFNLNLFESLDPDIQPAITPNTYDITLAVTEQPPSAFNLGGGYSGQSGLFFFSDLQTRNFLGRGQQVSLKTQVGDEIVNYELRFREPWMWAPRRSLTYGIWHRTGRLDVFSANTTRTFNNDQTSTGTDITFGIPVSYNLLFNHTLKYEVVQLANDPENDYVIQSYAAQVVHDTRDVWFAPRTGHYVSFRAEKAFSTRETALAFERYDLTLKRFFPTTKNQTIATKLDISYLEGADQNRATTLFGYIVGSQDTVRGYNDFFAFGARRAIANIEYRWFVKPTVQLSLFLDAGNAPQAVDDSGQQRTRTGALGADTQSIYDIFKWRVGKGIGITVQSPLGPLKFDFANNDQNIWLIQFNFGNAF